MKRLNPQATPFFPKPNLSSMEPYHQGQACVVPLPPPFYLHRPTEPPPPPPAYFEQPYFLRAVREEEHHLQPENSVDSSRKQEDASERISKRQFLRGFFTGYGRGKRTEVRRTKGFRSPPLASRPKGFPEGTLGNLRVFPRNKKTKHPLVPVQREGNTTIMIRNIPNRYTFVAEPRYMPLHLYMRWRAMLIEFLDKHCLSENRKLASKEEEGGEGVESAFDLVYLPIDFTLNKGYGFVNFTNPEAAWRFYAATNNKKWDYFQSNKVCDNVAARLQGKEKLASHLNSMKFPPDWDEVLPVCFSPPRDGTVKGGQRTLGKPNGGGSSRASVCQWKEKTPLAVQQVSS